jgi:plastocyanin
MTDLIKGNGRKMFATGFAAGVTVLAVMAFTWSQPATAPPRELVLLAKEITFLDAAQPGETNPTLALKKGEPVKLIVRNEETGQVLHCFTIGGLGVKTSRSLSAGESEELTFTPKRKGTFAYACLMHPGMGGKIVVQ